MRESGREYPVVFVCREWRVPCVGLSAVGGSGSVFCVPELFPLCVNEPETGMNLADNRKYLLSFVRKFALQTIHRYVEQE